MNDDQLSMIDERLPQAANCKPRTGHRSRVTSLILVAGIGIFSSSTSALAAGSLRGCTPGYR
jgi:hypothetical protein